MSNESLRDRLKQCLGGEWPEPCELAPEVKETIQEEGYRIEKVEYSAEPDDRVPAYLLVPDGVDAEHPAPGIAIWHQHAGQWRLGKSEPAGLDGNPMHHTGLALAKEGYVVLCPDTLCFEERQSPHLEGRDFEWFTFLQYVVNGKCLAWKNILDMRRAVDYLQSRPEVQGDRLGCYGHSMGSTCAWLVGPFEPRLKCVVGNCCLPTYEGIHKHYLRHCATNFIPGFYPYGDHYDIAALIAPRALHLNFGEDDGGSPIEVVRKGVKVIRQRYEAQGAGESFSFFIEEGVGHVLSERMWELTREKFETHLRKERS
ncbi:MAG: hypothetical protein GXP25_19685 [Planctomycetes bacterium]|nr:hypothetical protein [Planctomycetota bacterium]